MELAIYSAVGDIITVLLCIICWLFLRSTYTTKQVNLNLFYIANSALCIAAISHSFFQYFLRDIQSWNITLLYTLHATTYIGLALILVLYCLYLGNLFLREKKSLQRLCYMTIPAFIMFSLYKILSPIFNIGFYIDDNFVPHYNYVFNIFIVYYLYMCSLVIILIYKFKKRLINKTHKCLQCIVFVSFLVVILGHIYNSVSFVCISFLFPILSVMFFFHYNAYDTRTGTLDFQSFDSYIKEIQHKPFGVFGLFLKNFPFHEHPELAERFLPYLEKYFSDYCMFRISDAKMMLVYPKKHNSSDENLIKNILTRLQELYQEYKIPYQLVYISSDKKLKQGEDYIGLCNMLYKKMELDTFYKCHEDDVNTYIETSSIKDVLLDIYKNQDLNDDRVQVYCQPILDVKTNTYKNAEALMRIEANGIQYMPDEFIPIAESNGYVRMLSKIILNKTCQSINELLDEGYKFDRISINFSTMDFRERDFYKEILAIIESNNTPIDKIAIEITESEEESDYKLINRAIKKLRDKGIVFYLDDFGTGYSNFQRTFTLPVDIIKFDRSLTTLACNSSETYSMVKKFSHMLADFGYKILFEGVETPDEEDRCKEMNPHYLQGYNYSMPVEISCLRNYLIKTN